MGDYLDEKARQSGLEILSFWDNGIRHTSKLIESPTDIAGVKIRRMKNGIASIGKLCVEV